MLRKHSFSLLAQIQKQLEMAVVSTVVATTPIKVDVSGGKPLVIAAT